MRQNKSSIHRDNKARHPTAQSRRMPIGAC
jgi:hypothetical protein